MEGRKKKTATASIGFVETEKGNQRWIAVVVKLQPLNIVYVCGEFKRMQHVFMMK